MTALATDALPAVDLAELNARAALLTRTDRKYVLDRAQLPALLDRLPTGTRVLDIDGVRSFAYVSVYLDTPDRTAFRASAQRRRHRWKVRTRTYLDSGAQFLEVKTRSRGATVKERVAWGGGTDLDAAARGFVGASLAGAGLTLDAARLAPALATTYRRTTLLLPDGARATVDTALTWADAVGPAQLVGEGLVIVETKTAGPASAVDTACWRLGHRPTAVSKYASGLAALDPTLPRNRWHRLLASPAFACPRP